MFCGNESCFVRNSTGIVLMGAWKSQSTGSPGLVSRGEGKEPGIHCIHLGISAVIGYCWNTSNL